MVSLVIPSPHHRGTVTCNAYGWIDWDWSESDTSPVRLGHLACVRSYNSGGPLYVHVLGVGCLHVCVCLDRCGNWQGRMGRAAYVLYLWVYICMSPAWPISGIGWSHCLSKWRYLGGIYLSGGSVLGTVVGHGIPVDWVALSLVCVCVCVWSRAREILYLERLIMRWMGWWDGLTDWLGRTGRIGMGREGI